jgi:hypothetical protein
MNRARGSNRLGMNAEATAGAIGKEVPQRRRNGAEGKLRPGNGTFMKQLHLEAFFARGKAEIEQTRLKEDVYLLDVRSVHLP